MRLVLDGRAKLGQVGRSPRFHLGFVTLGKTLSEFLFPYLQNGDNNYFLTGSLEDKREFL
jgi:hypothetical protein